MKITEKRLKEIIKEELEESVPVPRTWLRHASALIRKASRHVGKDQAARLGAISEELIQMVEPQEAEYASRYPDPFNPDSPDYEGEL